MIVTCPNCASKYRVQDDKVPEGGAQLRCPDCDQMFIARRPKKSDVDVANIVGGLRADKERLEAELADSRRIVDGLREELDRRRAEVGQLAHEKSELLTELQDAETRVSLAQDGLATARQNHQQVQDQVQRLEIEAREARGAAERYQADLNLAQQTIQTLKQQQQRMQIDMQLGGVEGARVDELEKEVQRLRAQLAQGGGVAPETQAALEAVAPMLWGLDQAIQYIEPFAPNQQALVNHLKHLKLLAATLKRLKESLG